MTNSIGDIIKRERKKRNWNQAELIRQLGGGLKQQAVSSWENGGRPQAELIPRIAEVLEIESTVLMKAAGYTPTAGSVNGVESPVRPRLTTLPFGSLSPEQFEQFTADLAAVLYPDTHTYRYGGVGHKQEGIDVASERDGSFDVVFQCKRHKTFGKSMVQKAVADTNVVSKNYVITLSRVASPEARDEIALYPLWELWDIEDLSRILRDRSKVSLEAAIQIVDTYFPNWREPFLGVPEPGPWVASDVFFRPFSGDRLFSHEWQLVGRTLTLEQIVEFLTTKKDQLGVVTGRGGVGKTRLLRAVAQKAENELDYKVRFLSSTQEVRSADFEKLPPDEKLVVIIDDAHDRTDVAELLSGINRTRPAAKIILALRPYGMSELAYALRKIGLHPSSLPTWPLDDLKQKDSEALAREVIGEGYSEALIRRLAGLTKDCPLITVVGAGLIRRGQLDPDRLEGDESVRVEILRAFRDSLVVDSTQGEPRVMRSLLNALSILQPVHIAKEAFQKALENLTKETYDELLPYLRSLEDAGVLVRRGQSLRLLPDLLGDVVLAEACFDDRSGVGTGYIERVHRETEGETLQHVIINASRVDWQVKRKNTEVPSLVTSLWDAIEIEFKNASVGARQEMVKLLQRVSYYQPDRALAILKFAIENPIGPEPIEGLPEKYWPSYGQVIYEIPGALKPIAYNLDQFRAVVDLLWNLVKKSTRASTQQPESLRQLSSLAEFEGGKPVTFHYAMIDAAEEWLKDRSINDLPYSPFDVLESMLTTEGADNFTEGLTISFQPYALNVEVVKPIHERIIDVALKEVKSHDPVRGVRAIQAIGHSLRYPSGLFGRSVEAAEREKWTPVFKETIGKLADIALDPQLDPIVLIALREALKWHADYSKTETKQAAHKVIDTIPRDLPHELALVLYDGWGHLLYNRTLEGGYEKAEQKKTEHFREVAEGLTAEYSDAEVVRLIEERLVAQHRSIRKDTHPGAFIWELLEVNPSIGLTICKHVESDPQSPLRDLLSIVISRLMAHESKKVMDLIDRLLKLEAVEITRAIANALGWSRGRRDNFLDGEMELLRLLAVHSDEFVRTNVIRVAETVDRFDHAKAMEIFSVVKLDSSGYVAEELFSAFGPYGQEFDWDELPSTQQEAVLEYLLRCPELDDHHATSFLVKLAEKDPDGVLTLLKHRIELSENKEAPEGYDAFPYWYDESPFSKHPQRPQLLRQIRDWMNEKPNSYRRAHDGADVFKLAAGRLSDKVVLTILDEFVTTGEKTKLQTVADILRQSSAEFMWENVDFVKRLLNAANQHGEKCFRHVRSALYGAVISGSRNGTPGEPFPEDIAQRDNAAKIAATLTPGSIEEEFYRLLERQAVDSIRSHAEDDEKLLDGREW